MINAACKQAGAARRSRDQSAPPTNRFAIPAWRCATKARHHDEADDEERDMNRIDADVRPRPEHVGERPAGPAKRPRPEDLGADQHGGAPWTVDTNVSATRFVRRGAV